MQDVSVFHVIPGLLDCFERIGCPGIGRAGVGDSEPRPASGGAVLRDGVGETVRRETKFRVSRQRTDLIGMQADDAGRPIDGPVALFAQVEDGPATVLYGTVPIVPDSFYSGTTYVGCT